MRHPLDTDAIHQDIFVLLHLVYGADEFSDMHGTRSAEVANLIEGDQYWSRLQRQVSELLVGIAVRSRIIFDDKDERHIAATPDDYRVGHFVLRDGIPDESQAFSVREACNKVLHAASIEFERNGFDEKQHWNGIVQLKGVHRREPWEVALFVNSCATRISAILAQLDKGT